MSPRAGGEADKFGNRYEGAWTVRQVLDVLRDRANRITVEATGEDGTGVEFILRRPSGVEEAHQVKRQRGRANSWTLRSLEAEGVLEAADAQAAAGREFHFVSTIPARPLDRLADRARRSKSLHHFIDGFLDGEEIRADFDFLASKVWGSPARSWEVLRAVQARWPDERELRDTNAALAGVLLVGAEPGLSWLALGDLVANNLGLPLDRSAVKERLGDYGLRIDPLSGRGDLATTLGDLTETWREVIGAELLDPEIVRDETAAIAEGLSAEMRVVVASGDAGDGKSGVLRQVAGSLAAKGWHLLAFRLDRLRSFGTPAELGRRLGLPSSPVAALASVSGDGPALLVIDQLDAVSLLSGRMPSSFDAVLALLREAAAFPEVRVLLACREFDLRNDNRLRRLVEDYDGTQRFAVGPLSEQQVSSALERLGVDRRELDAPQLELLGSPLHLVLLSAALGEEGALTFESTKDLFDLYWDSKVRAVRRDRQPAPRFAEVIDVLVEAMSTAQRLAVPAAVLDDGDLLSDADVLASEHVLVRDGVQIAFFHEAFFDYAFARRWIRRGQSLVAFLLDGEQELFRRAQVRQVLNHLRDEDRGRFTREIKQILLNPQVRFHLKDVALRLVAEIRDPAHEEWMAVDDLLSRGLPFEDRIWSSLRTDGWFDRLSEEGKLKEWLESPDGKHRARGMEILISAARARTDAVADLVAGRKEASDYPQMLLAVARFAELSDSRKLFDLVLEAVRDGQIDPTQRELWLDVHGLGEARPDWAIELLRVFLVERPARLSLNQEGQIADLTGRDHDLLELLSQSSRRRPLLFCEALLPYLLEAMAATAGESGPPVRDRHFGFRIWRADIHEVDDGLLYGMRNALARLAADEPEALEPFIRLLESDPHDAAQWLLYEALRAAGRAYANRAGEILLQAEARLMSGYLDSALWTTRQLIVAIGPNLRQDLLARLEQALIDYRPDHEGSRAHGYSSFTLLSGLPEDRLSERGRRTLGELRRKFESEEPPQPMGIRVGTVGPPIPEDSARRMNDEQWRGAIAKYSTGERSAGRIELRGDAEELARVLEEEAKRDPERFAGFATRFDTATHPAYGDALLRGVGDPDAGAQPRAIFALVKRIAELGRTENDRWLGWALRGTLDGAIPDEIVELVLDRALHSPDPEEEAWLTEAWGGKTFYGGDPWMNGMNSSRGGAAESLADILAHDVDGHRSAIVAPYLVELAGDRSVAVRSSVARLLSAALRFECPRAVEAFAILIDTDERLLAARPVEELIAHVGHGDADVAGPTIELMLKSRFESVRETGGRLAAYAGLELGLGELLPTAAESADAAVRIGAAKVCAGILGATTNPAVAAAMLVDMFDDEDKGVRAAAAEVAMSLRGRDLTEHMEILRALIASPAFESAVSQLLLTLETSTGPLEEVALQCAERFVALHRDEVGDISTGAAGDVRQVAELLLRTYSQSRDLAVRGRTLDLIDELLALRAYGVDELVSAAER